MQPSPDAIKATLAQRGARATPKRIRVMTLLLEQSPISAYELVDVYQDQYGERLQPTSAYRLLDALVSVGMVHKVSSINRYMACCHALEDEVHGATQLLVCTRCNKVQEVPSTAVLELHETASAHGFQCDLQPAPELLGQCESCS